MEAIKENLWIALRPSAFAIAFATLSSRTEKKRRSRLYHYGRPGGGKMKNEDSSWSAFNVLTVHLSRTRRHWGITLSGTTNSRICCMVNMKWLVKTWRDLKTLIKMKAPATALLFKGVGSDKILWRRIFRGPIGGMGQGPTNKTCVLGLCALYFQLSAIFWWLVYSTIILT